MKKLITLCTLVSIGSLHSAVTEITSKEQLNRELKKSKPSAVCFYSPTCPHCRSYEPKFTQMSFKHNNVNFLRVNVKEHGNLARPYNVTGVPRTVIFDKTGQRKESISGNNPAKVEETLQALMVAEPRTNRPNPATPKMKTQPKLNPATPRSAA